MGGGGVVKDRICKRSNTDTSVSLGMLVETFSHLYGGGAK